MVSDLGASKKRFGRRTGRDWLKRLYRSNVLLLLDGLVTAESVGLQDVYVGSVAR